MLRSRMTYHRSSHLYCVHILINFMSHLVFLLQNKGFLSQPQQNQPFSRTVLVLVNYKRQKLLGYNIKTHIRHLLSLGSILTKASTMVNLSAGGSSIGLRFVLNIFSIFTTRSMGTVAGCGAKGLVLMNKQGIGVSRL